ncbi:hypothetical protein [Kitasatospora cineracea]|uniref:hypothetical protein n=1 Tax=Kitasatospora cineracea TaxID=88074 RepID=UPI0013C3402A
MTVPRALPGLPDPQGARLQVDVTPLESERLALPQTERQRDGPSTGGQVITLAATTTVM